MVDRDAVENTLAPLWRGTVQRVAVLAGAGTALASLVFDVPVRVAALRGAFALFGVLVLGRVTASALSRAERATGEEASS